MNLHTKNDSKYCYVIPTIQFRRTFKEFQILLFCTNNACQHYLFVCTQLNGSNYYYVSLTIHLDISHLFTQLNGQIVQFLAIQFSVIHLFARMFKWSNSSI